MFYVEIEQNKEQTMQMLDFIHLIFFNLMIQ